MEKKAVNRFFGYHITPFGPQSYDTFLAKILRCKGDFVPDFRLLDYPAALLSTNRTCCQDGSLGNDIRLKADLESLGIFDTRMSLYQLYKLREHKQIGFSGFEGRYYSLFPSFKKDLSRATDLQILLNALVYKYMANGIASHDTIPGTPVIESERRQIFFAAAIGLPTFFVKNSSGNLFLRHIISRSKQNRPSKRYPGYTRVLLKKYLLALVEMIEEECPDLVDYLHATPLLNDLKHRINHPYSASACAKLVGTVIGRNKRPKNFSAAEFNAMAEKHYRTDLNLALLKEGWEVLAEDLLQLHRTGHFRPWPWQDQTTCTASDCQSHTGFLTEAWNKLTEQRLTANDCTVLIRLLINAEEHDTFLNTHGE